MEFLVELDGQLIPDPEHDEDPKHIADIKAAMDFFGANADRVKHFKNRLKELGKSGLDTVITVIDVDDTYGGMLADALMPNHDWQQYRDAGEIPVARGLANKDGIVGFLEAAHYYAASNELREANDIRVLVLHSAIALVLDVEFKPETTVTYDAKDS